MKRKVEVRLVGRNFTIRSEQDEAYLHSLAGFVTRKFEELQRSTRSATTHDLALLVAMNIADELFQAEQQSAETRQQVRARTERILNGIEQALKSGESTEERPAVATAPANNRAV